MHAPAFAALSSGQARTRAVWAALSVIALMTLLRAAFAALIDLRTDEAYYWTWSKENVLSFLDHPPMVAWFVRAGTALFGDTAFGARAGGLVAMAGMQWLLADIVRRKTERIEAVIFMLLAPEATLYYGLMMTLVAPDVPLVLFLSAMVWALVRLDESRDPRWWLAAGACGGLALLSKYTAALYVPAILAFTLWPPRNRGWLRTAWPWLAAGVALLVFSPVLLWNAQNDWASFRFQFVRLTDGRPWSLAWFAEFIGLQWGLIGPLLFPVILAGTAIAGWDGYRRHDAVRVLLATAATVPFGYLLWRAGWLRINVTWSLALWPAAFAGAALTLDHYLRQGGSSARLAGRSALAAVGIGVCTVLLVFGYYLLGTASLIGKRDPIGQEAGYKAIATDAVATMRASGASWIATTEYRTYAMLRWHLRDRVPVVQINERSRFIGFDEAALGRIAGQPGLYVVPQGRLAKSLWLGLAIQRRTVGVVWRKWRGGKVHKFYFQSFAGWTPKRGALVPGSALYAAVPFVPPTGQRACAGIGCRAPF